MTHQEFWNDLYRKASPASSGAPGLALAQFTGPLAAGHALELGCARGDDAVWLARQGWTVTATDISTVALGYAEENARRAGVAHRLSFEAHDLAVSFPKGRCDLVTASFLHSPQDWPRAKVLAQAAEAVSDAGHLLIVEHASRAPWSWAPETTRYPTAEDTLASLRLPDDMWQRLCVCQIARRASGPDGQEATVTDNIIFLQRLAGAET
ncbi:class I SAM-dependent methyltransferase [Falsirhodobacter sp. 20TX0035]|uniref:class I SAM-dependent methyltransferase n=1 Tax=Falsirhodobacter sp. 20TX0035 TaxID=3022019 RepID=UPI00232EFA76|nr:class I SAM-dependent methyltransferase [Falsirhodobacter sp. 20TX0035]MDB6454252.1 methyltransferase domain-containing protein [Falsirhodobacter sp. 20TX0035]